MSLAKSSLRGPASEKESFSVVTNIAISFRARTSSQRKAQSTWAPFARPPNSFASSANRASVRSSSGANRLWLVLQAALQPPNESRAAQVRSSTTPFRPRSTESSCNEKELLLRSTRVSGRPIERRAAPAVNPFRKNAPATNTPMNLVAPFSLGRVCLFTVPPCCLYCGIFASMMLVFISRTRPLAQEARHHMASQLGGDDRRLARCRQGRVDMYLYHALSGRRDRAATCRRACWQCDSPEIYVRKSYMLRGAIHINIDICVRSCLVYLHYPSAIHRPLKVPKIDIC